MLRHKKFIASILISSLLSVSSCNAAPAAVTIEDNSELLPGVVYKDSRFTGEYKGVTINASFYDEGSHTDEVNIYKAHYVDRSHYDKYGFNSGVLTFKEAANDELNRVYYTDPDGVDFLVHIDDNGRGFYCAEICRLYNDGASRFLQSLNNNFDNDYTEVLTHISHIRPDSIPEDKDLPTAFDYWEVLSFNDGSYYACRNQSIDGIPLLDSTSDYELNWSDKYKGWYDMEGFIRYKNTSGYWYVFEARGFVDVDKEPVESCKVKGINDCFEQGIKDIKSLTSNYGKNPVVYDVAFGYINIMDEHSGELTLVPVWRFKAYFPKTNHISSSFVNASTGESLW